MRDRGSLVGAEMGKIAKDVFRMMWEAGSDAADQAGNTKAFNALIGQAMKASKGKVNLQQVNALLKEKLVEG